MSSVPDDPASPPESLGQHPQPIVTTNTTVDRSAIISALQSAFDLGPGNTAVNAPHVHYGPLQRQIQLLAGDAINRMSILMQFYSAMIQTLLASQQTHTAQPPQQHGFGDLVFDDALLDPALFSSMMSALSPDNSY